MWMMGYNEVPLEDHDPINMVESNYSTNSRRFRPLVPRPPPPTCATASSSANRFHSTHHDHLIPFNNNLVTNDQQNKREFNSQQMVVVSSRWNPTPEQLQTLEELYRRGTRTPSADEIQHITAQLRRYGKIEGKNVFYWFQNHKARERQKRRRQLDNPTTDVHQPPPFFSIDTNNTIQCKDNSEVEETRNWAIPTFSEKSVLSERAGKSESRMTTIAAAAEDKRWIPVEQQEQDDEEEEEEEGGNDQVLLVHRRRKNFPARNSPWHDMMQSLSSSSSATTNHIPLMINSTCTPPTIIPTSVSKTVSSIVVSSHNQQFQHEIDYCYQTLELFPVNSNGGHGGVEQPTEKCFVPTSDVSHSTPRQFIEFLPLKN